MPRLGAVAVSLLVAVGPAAAGCGARTGLRGPRPDAGDVPPDGEEMCVDRVLTFSRPPNSSVVFLADASTSMGDFGSSGRSKWDDAKAAITSIADSWDTRIAFGLLVFPATSDACAPGTIAVPVGPATAPAIRAALDARFPGGRTPTAASLPQAAAALAAAPGSGAKFNILITDGSPNCNPALDPSTCTCSVRTPGACSDADLCLDDVVMIGEIQNMADAGFRTYVIGLLGGTGGSSLGDPIARDVLNRAAVAGGTARSGPTQYYDVLDTSTLASTLGGIITTLASCEFPVSGISAEDVATRAVAVSFAGTPIARDPSHTNGWDFDAATPPQHIDLFGAACDLLRTTQPSDQLEVDLVCPAP